jgi:hypothetical protein
VEGQSAKKAQNRKVPTTIVPEKTCPVCLAPTGLVDYKAHFESNHPGEPFKPEVMCSLMKCQLCDYFVKQWKNRYSDINRHLVVKHGLGDRARAYRVQCPQCDHRAMTKWTLESHMHLAHGAEKTHQCDECAAVFSNLGSLGVHKKEKHPKEGQMRFCQICGLEFTMLAYYSHMQQKHSTDRFVKSYQCTDCDKSFRTRHGLRGHLAR